MQKEYTVIDGVSVMFTDTKEQLIEWDAILPDYYPEIDKLLKCSVCPGIEDITRTGDKVSVAGKADMHLLYLDKDKHINIFSSVIKYTRIFSGVPDSEEETFFVTQNITGIEQRATAPRKCDVRATAAVKLVCVGKKEENILSGIDRESAEILYNEKEIFSVNAIKSVELDFSENVDLPQSETEINGVLYTTRSIEFTELKAIKNKVMIKGVCNVSACFVTADGAIMPEVSYSLPFTDISGIPGADENDECYFVPEDICVRFNTENGGKKAQLFVNARIKCMCGVKLSLNLPVDAYSVKEEISIKKTNLCAISNIQPVEKSFSVKGDAEIYDTSAVQISAFFAGTPQFSLSPFNGSLHLCGTVNVNFVLMSDNGNISLISRSCNYDENTELDGDTGTAVFCEAHILSANIKNGRIDYMLKLCISGYSFEKRCSDFITDIEAVENSAKNRDCEKIVLYYAHKGESIWNIAKENGFSAEKIKEYNNFSGEVTEESRMLILVN